MNRLLLLAIAGLALLSLCAGQSWISPLDFFSDSPAGWIASELRAPRVVLALAIGAALGAAGALLQGLTRNPLADAGVLGISSCASLGAVTALFFGLASAVPIAAIAGAALGIAALLGLVQRTDSAVHFLLAGVMLNIVAGALTSLVIALSPSPYAISEIITWMLGGLTDRSWRDVAFAVPAIIAGVSLMLTQRRALDGLALGDDTARTLGVSRSRVQLVAILGAGLAVGAAVSVSGVIGFVGLVVPHLVRSIVGARPAAVIIPATLGGALFLALADLAVRLIPTAGEIKLGVVMALIGGPLFVLIISRAREPQL